MLDEPTASLDPETAQYVREILKQQQAVHNVSMLFTSHNMAEVEELCDRVIFIQNGTIVAEDKPENLAKKIKHSKLELVLTDGLKRVVQLCETLKLTHKVTKRAIEINIEEHTIAQFLNTISQQGIEYDQISIKKPDLEDFFLEVASNKK